MILASNSFTGLIFFPFGDYDNFNTISEPLWELLPPMPKEAELEMPAPVSTVFCVKQFSGMTFSANPRDDREMNLKFCSAGAEPTVCIVNGEFKNALCGMVEGKILPHFYPIAYGKINYVENFNH